MIETIRSSLTLSSGSWSWKTGERPVILPLRFVYVCCGVLSPGAEISQYSAILLVSLRNKSTELKLTWMFFHTISSKTLPTPIYHYFANLSAWQSRARTLVHPIAGDLSTGMASYRIDWWFEIAFIWSRGLPFHAKSQSILFLNGCEGAFSLLSKGQGN